MEGPISSRNQDRQATRVDPSEIAHHLRVAADKYHENAQLLLEQMHAAIGAVSEDQKPAFRTARENLAKLFNEQASDAIRLAVMFDGVSAEDIELGEDDQVVGMWFGASHDERAVAATTRGARSGTPKSSKDKISDIRTKLVAGQVDRPAVPEGRATPACDNELMAAVNSSGGDLCSRCGAPIDHNEPHTECDECRAGENDGSLQHTPTTWVGNELVNRPIGGAE